MAYLDRQFVVSAEMTLGKAIIPWSSWDVSRESDKLSGDFKITLPSVIPDFEENTPVEISVTVNDQSYKLIEDARIKNITQNSSVSDPLISSINGFLEKDLDTLLTAPSKDMYFVSANWLNDKWGQNGWKLQNGQLVTVSIDARGIQQGNPLNDSLLPGKDVEPDTYKIVIGAPTNRQLAQYLCQQLGFQFSTNLPTWRILSVWKLDSTKSYWDSIQDVYKIWNADFKLVEKDGITTLFVCDICGNSASIQQTGSLNIPASLLTVKNYSESRRGSEVKVIDHVIIKGSKTKIKNTSVKMNTSNLTSPKLAATELSEDRQVSWRANFQDNYGRKKMGEYTTGFGKDPKELSKPKQTYCTTYYHVNPKDASDWKPVRIEQITYDFNDKIISKIIVRNKYSKSLQLVETIHEEYGWCAWPGQPYQKFIKFKDVISSQDNLIAELNLSSKTEITEEQVLVDRRIDKNTGNEYYDAAQNLHDATQNSAVQTNPRTRQTVIEMTTKTKNYYLDRVSQNVLLQMEVEYDRINGTTTCRPDIVKNPFKVSSSGGDKQFSKEFFDGPGPDYQPALVIEHPDIDMDEKAYEIAQRVFAKNRRDRNQDVRLTVEVALPLPIVTTDVILNLPDLEYMQLRGTLYEQATIPGGSYVLKKVSTSMSENDLKQTLELGVVV